VILGIGLFGSAGALVIYDVYILRNGRLLRRSSEGEAAERTTTFLPAPLSTGALAARTDVAGLAVLPLLIAKSIAWSGRQAGVRVSQFWGVRPAPLSGVHLVTPLVDSVALYERGTVYLTSAAEAASSEGVADGAGSEGLNIGIAVAVRYRIDPRRLSYFTPICRKHRRSSRSTFVGRPIVRWPNYVTREILR